MKANKSFLLNILTGIWARVTVRDFAGVSAREQSR